MSKTLKKPKSSKQQCTVIIKKGKRKGKRCHHPSSKTTDRCIYHNDSNLQYLRKVNITKRYDNIIRKVKELYISEKAMLEEIRKDIKTTERKLYGIKLFIGDKTLKRRKHYKYIKYTKHYNITVSMKQAKTLENKLEDLKNQKENIKEHIDKIGKALEIFKE